MQIFLMFERINFLFQKTSFVIFNSKQVKQLIFTISGMLFIIITRNFLGKYLQTGICAGAGSQQY